MQGYVGLNDISIEVTAISEKYEFIYGTIWHDLEGISYKLNSSLVLTLFGKLVTFPKLKYK